MTLPIQLGPRPETGRLVPFRFRPVGEQVLLTSHFGDWVFVSPEELARISRGELEGGSPLEERLASANFLREGLDRNALAERLRTKKRFLNYGPNLHVVVVTLRCNETCVYCHASRATMDRVDTDMTPEVAERTVDLILQTTSPRVTIEFQGGEPLANFPVVKHLIEYALEKNRAYGKDLEFTLVSNLSLMTDDVLEYLASRRVQICTSVDGPEKLHNKQRVLPSDNAYQKAAGWIRRINDRYIESGLDPVLYHVEALLTTTRAALDYPKQIVDTYVDLGCHALFLRPVDPFGFASTTASTVEYERRRYLDFYRTAVDYMLELNREGVQVLERFASIFLTKILTNDDPNFLDIRSPCGAGIGQVAYNYDGKVFTCDEGRMVHQMGDSAFLIGEVGTSSYRDLMTHDTVRSLLVASNLDAQPDCVNCVYNPYCGVCPVHNYASQGSIQGRMRESHLCAVHKGIQDYLFEKLQSGDEHVLSTFRRWTTVRERSHFVHASTAS
jgi:His-Xaa-Ser system radical SAM maturase HxsB